MSYRLHPLMYLSLALALLLLAACGRTPAGEPTVVTRTVGPAGGELESASHSVRVLFAPGALRADTAVTLRLFAEQFTEIGRDGYLHSETGVQLSFVPGAVAPGGTVVLELEHLGDYDSFGTMLAVMRDDGALLALPSSQAAPGVVRGELSAEILAALFGGAPPEEPRALKVFSANRQAELAAAGALLTEVQGFSGGVFGGAPPELMDKRVAVVVHGLDSSLADLSALGAFLQGFRLSGQDAPYYDAVIGFNYSSNAPLAEIGTALADAMAHAGLPSAAAADLFAHSMGNLVSRYAMETTALPNRLANIGHYVSLGGPHAGVPFDALSYAVQTFFYFFALEAEPCIRDLLTDGKDGAPETDFLTALNLQAGAEGPNYGLTRYYTMSGDDYADYDPPLGWSVHGLYLLSLGLDDSEQDDGLVAQYSAQSTVLSRQSATWQANAPFALSHQGLHSAPEALEQLGSWIESWQAP